MPMRPRQPCKGPRPWLQYRPDKRRPLTRIKYRYLCHVLTPVRNRSGCEQTIVPHYFTPLNHILDNSAPHAVHTSPHIYMCAQDVYTAAAPIQVLYLHGTEQSYPLHPALVTARAMHSAGSSRAAERPRFDASHAELPLG